jgi:hypothetical protein
MKKVDQYRQTLGSLEEWEPFLRQKSGLPGPRGNLELAHTVADLGNEALFRRLLENDPTRAPTNSPGEFLAFCGVLGLGKLLAGGREDVLEALRMYAGDPRWRVREAVAMALQRLGDADMALLLRSVQPWLQGSLLERRAVAAGLCEPRLLRQPEHAAQVLQLLDQITGSLLVEVDRRSEPFRVLRQALGYCWSVAVVALPEAGRPALERWVESDDPDARWIVRENLRKKRLARMDEAWVARCQARSNGWPGGSQEVG